MSGLLAMTVSTAAASLAGSKSVLAVATTLIPYSAAFSRTPFSMAAIQVFPESPFRKASFRSCP